MMEVCSNTAVGYAGSLVITYLCMQYSPYSIPTTSVLVVNLCTAWSLLRGYYMRRFFNSLSTRGRTRMNKESN